MRAGSLLTTSFITICLSAAACAPPPSVPTVAIGGAVGAPSDGAPAARSGAGDPLRPLSETVVAGARAIVSAARGEPHDKRWDCDTGDEFDLRSTSREESQKFLSSGAGREPLFYSVDGFELAARPAKGTPSWLGLRAELAFWPDGHMRFTSVKTGEAKPDELFTVSDLPPPLRGPLEHLGATLAGPACDLAVPTRAEIDQVLQPARRDKAMAKLADAAAAARGACAAFRDAQGPWKTTATEITVAFAAGERIVTLRSAIAMVKDHLCIGHVRVTTDD